MEVIMLIRNDRTIVMNVFEGELHISCKKKLTCKFENILKHIFLAYFAYKNGKIADFWRNRWTNPFEFFNFLFLSSEKAFSLCRIFLNTFSSFYPSPTCGREQ